MHQVSALLVVGVQLSSWTNTQHRAWERQSETVDVHEPPLRPDELQSSLTVLASAMAVGGCGYDFASISISY